MAMLKWWLRIVGALYVMNAVMMAVVRAPIRSAGPDQALALAAEGDPTARFLLDTWVGFGLEVGAIGLVLSIASRSAHQARWLVWAVIAIEVLRGVAYDAYMLARGYPVSVYLPWIVIHGVVIVTGVMALRSSGGNGSPG